MARKRDVSHTQEQVDRSIDWLSGMQTMKRNIAITSSQHILNLFFQTYIHTPDDEHILSSTEDKFTMCILQWVPYQKSSPFPYSYPNGSVSTLVSYLESIHTYIKIERLSRRNYFPLMFPSVLDVFKLSAFLLL